MMKWILAFHIIFVIAWFAGLFYLPRLYVYHADATDTVSIARFKIMERRLYFGIMMPAGVLASGFGLALILMDPTQYMHAWWLHIKLILVALLWAYQFYLGRLRLIFQYDQNQRSAKFYRIINEIPTVFLILIVILAVVQPF